jgi:hypothetical protein
VAFAFIRGRITCWRLRKLEQQERQQLHQMLEQQLQKQERQLVQLERLPQQELLFYRKQREQQQPGGSPTGAIFSCQFSLEDWGGKTIFENCHGFHHDRAEDLEITELSLKL